MNLIFLIDINKDNLHRGVVKSTRFYWMRNHVHHHALPENALKMASGAKWASSERKT